MNRKQGILFIVFLLGSILLLGCSNKTTETDLNGETNLFVYPQEEVSTISIDNEGTFYMAAPHSEDETSIFLVDEEGNVVKTFIINTNGMYIHTMEVQNQTLYYIINQQIWENNNLIKYASLYSYHFDSGEQKELYQFKDYSEINDLDIIGDIFYFIGVNSNHLDKSYELRNDTPTYSYNGENVGAFFLTENKSVELLVDFPISIGKSSEDTLLIYAYDSEGGYYFTEYNMEKNTYSDKVYKAYNITGDFSIINQKNDIVYYDNQRSVLVAASTVEKQYTAEIMPVANSIGTYLTGYGDYTYYFDSQIRKVVRIKNSVYMRGNKSIQMISYASDFSAPFGYGYTILRDEYFNDESFALKVLAQDRDFDLYLLKSRHHFSDNIRKNGAFYPLNEVEGVQEYLDSCFPYIKDAAMDEKGNIWMLPIEVEIPSLYYSDSNCKEQGIDFSKNITFEELVDLQLNILKERSIKGTYNIQDKSTFIRAILLQFLRSGLKVDSDEFRNLAACTKKYFNDAKDQKIQGSNNTLFGWYNDYFATLNMLTLSLHSRESFAPLLNSYNVLGMPDFDGNNTYIASGLFLCVNPASKNLKETLDYIEVLAKNSLQKGKPLLFKDKSLYKDTTFEQDIYEIYSRGELYFTIPEDVIYDDFYRYLNSEIELENMITEVTRKMEIYHNE